MSPDHPQNPPRRAIRAISRGACTLAAIVALLVTVGCSFTRPPPVKQTFLLAPAMPAAAGTTHSGAARVGIVNVAGPFRDRNFVVRVSDLRYETDYYDEFVTPPASMLAEATSRALSTAQVFAHVAPPGTPTQADYVLDGFASALYADHRTPAGCKAALAITWYLSQADAGNGVPFWSREYRREIDCGSGAAEAYVAALNTALSETLAALAADLAALKLPPPR